MTQNEKSPGVTLVGLIFLAFLVLKLCNVIDWSWWWITAPLWAPFAIAIVGATIYLIILKIKKWKRK